MKARNAGKRHLLLLYKRSMDRLWGWTLVLGILLAILWVGDSWNILPIFAANSSIWLLAGAAVSLGFSAFAFFARRMAYVQARPDCILIVTPFLKLKISYRRIRAIHPTSFQQLFPPVKMGSLQRRFLQPFYGQTAVVVDLSSYPMRESLLRLFLPPQMFSPEHSGMVLLVADWMDLSTELDSLQGGWLQDRANQQRFKATRRA
jgi:hypothetical protein